MYTALLIASSNPGKVQEICQVLSDLALDTQTLADFPGVPQAEESGNTFSDNACAKAMHYAQHTDLLTLADDSGLEVDCLGGQPGVRSARFAGPQQKPQANNQKLIALLRDVPLQDRTARFRCAVALANGSEVLAIADGTVEGLIIDVPRGQFGFGYDAHFLIPDLQRTSAEIEPELKNQISHRGLALQRIRPEIVRLCNARS